ncbi:uncharacterized protein JCM6883_006245 [Sporobolomyces salmoneus]|uniref:uncharacterized protein n=1 Tax=Sporobolomyces salmoneus TaxID=183962 RepID=UPI00317D5041
MSTATATRPTPVRSTGYSPRQRFLALLLITAALGTSVSVFQTSAATTAFRSRLPAHTISRLTSSESAFPVPSLPYFADKRNGLNQLFVKRSWAWVTGIYIFHSLALFLTAPLLTVNTLKKNDTPSPSQPAIQLSSAAKTPFNLIVTSLRRYLLSSLFWFYLTQKTWFGSRTGPSISSRILRTSGAVCVPSHLSSSNSVDSALAGAGAGGGGPASMICTGAPGEYWRGGHDVSGHSFMMIHCSMFLFELVHPLLPSLLPKYFTSTSTRTQPRKLPFAVQVTAWASIAMMGLCWWMLLMTSLFFHSPAEKSSGVAFGVLGWWVGGL